MQAMPSGAITSWCSISQPLNFFRLLRILPFIVASWVVLSSKQLAWAEESESEEQSGSPSKTGQRSPSKSILDGSTGTAELSAAFTTDSNTFSKVFLKKEGIVNSSETCLNPSDDGVGKSKDSDSDNMSDRAEGNADTDSDTIPDFRDIDSDNDGVPDSVEMMSDGTGDTDSDGIPNQKDRDTADMDGDGFDTEYADANGDGRLSPEELDAKADYQHLLCLDTDEDESVTKRELQMAWSDFRRSSLWKSQNVVEWIKAQPHLTALQSFADDHFHSIGGPLLFDYVVMKPYKVRTKLNLNEDAVDELRLAVCDIIVSEREKRIAQDAALHHDRIKGSAPDNAHAAGGFGDDDNASTAVNSYTGLPQVDWLLDKVDNIPWWAQGMLLTAGLVLCSAFVYQFEQKASENKRHKQKQKLEKEQAIQREKDAANLKRQRRALAVEKRRREAEAADEKRRNRRLRDIAKTSGKISSKLRRPSWNGNEQLNPNSRTQTPGLSKNDLANNLRSGSVDDELIRRVSSTLTCDSEADSVTIQARSKCKDSPSSALFDQAPSGLLHVHRTSAGVVPYYNVQFNRLQNLQQFHLDGRPEKDFLIRIPQTFRDSLVLIYGEGGMGRGKKRTFHLHYEYYNPATPGNMSPGLTRVRKISSRNLGGNNTSPRMPGATNLKFVPGPIRSLSNSSSTSVSSSGSTCNNQKDILGASKVEGKDIDVLVLYREIAHPSSSLKKASQLEGMIWRKEFCVLDSHSEVEWTGISTSQTSKAKLILRKVLVARDSSGKTRPQRCTRTLSVPNENNNYTVIASWVIVINEYLDATKVRRIERARHSLAFPAQMALE